MIKIFKQLQLDAPLIKAFEEQYLDSLIIKQGSIRILSDSYLDKRMKILSEYDKANLFRDISKSYEFYQVYYAAKERIKAYKIIAIVCVLIITIGAAIVLW